MTDNARLTAALHHALKMFEQTNKFQMAADILQYLQEHTNITITPREPVKAGRRAPAEKRQSAN